MRYKIFSLFLVASLLLCCGCQKKDAQGKPKNGATVSSEAIKTRDITLLYCQADTVNPYTCATKYNQELCNLLYDPLIKLDKNYAPQKCLASNIKSSASSVEVKLKSAKFSDGTALTASDVAYSFALAKGLSKYRIAFASVKCSQTDSQTLRFQLAAPNIGFVNFLDFPIIKANSDTIKNADHIAQPPIGCGRYIYKYDQAKLIANANYHGGNVNIPAILLLDSPDNKAASHYLEVGAVDYYYSDLSDGLVPKLNGTSRSITLNNLVYIGINQAASPLENPQIRRTLSAALNRTSLVETSFPSGAVVAKSPFHPLWKVAEGFQYIEEKENVDVVLANLEETGYNKKDNAGYFVNSAGRRLSFSLLCPSSDTQRVAAAEQIRSQFKKIGIEIKIEVVPFLQFMQRLAAGQFQLFLSEVRVEQDMDISPFTLPGGAVAYGVTNETADTKGDAASQSSSGASANDEQPINPENVETLSKTLSQAIAEYKTEKASIFDVVTTFNASMPIIPVCFKCGISICASDFSTAPYATSSDVFYNIENAVFK